MEQEAGYTTEADDTWEPFVVNYCLDADLTVSNVSAHGKNVAPTDWSHPYDGDNLPGKWEVKYGLDPADATGINGDDGDPDGDNFSNLHEYLIGTDPHSDLSEVEAIIFDEDVGQLDLSDFFDAVLITNNAALSYHGTNCVRLDLFTDGHNYSRIGFDAASFGNSDTLEFYIRTASGTYTNDLELRVFFSYKWEMDVPVDIRPYLYDSNGVPSSGITETYKRVSLPLSYLQQNGSNDVGTIRHLRLGVPDGEAPDEIETMYLDRISLQDRSGMSFDETEVLDRRHVKITGHDKPDMISLKTLTNHVVIRQSTGQPVPISAIGLRSWVTGFMGSGYDSPTMDHDIFIELSSPLASGETYTYSNSVQDVSGNYPADGAISFTFNDATNITSSIKINQVGWLPEATKIAYVGNWLGDLGKMLLDTNVSHTAYIRDAATGSNVFTAPLIKAVESDYFDMSKTNEPPFLLTFSGEEVWRVHFTSLETPGTYYLHVPGIGRSYEFEIGSNIYADTYYHCMRSLWYQRSGIEMTNTVYSASWPRQGDLQQNTNTAFYHNSILDLSPDLYAGEPIGGFADFTGGWYDAADYDKYTKSAADSVNLLLNMYEIIPERFTDSQLDIPESGNGIPDVLDEAKWELDWIAKMVSSNGAAFNKCTYKSWPQGMPNTQADKMWVTLKTTRDTAAACAILAKAARIIAPYDATSAALYSNKATLAWQCLTNNPDSYPIPPFVDKNGDGKDDQEWDDYHNPPGSGSIPSIGTGKYFGTNDVPYRLWAATAMYELTGDSSVHDEFSNIVYRAKGVSSATNFLKSIVGYESWMGNANAMILMYEYITLTNGLPVCEEWRSVMEDQFIDSVSNYWKTCDADLPYDFEIKSHSILQWGEGAQVRRPYGYILAHELTGHDWYLGEALKNIDWPLGANPLSQTYITGIGSKYPMHPHNKIDHGDGIDEPIPGFNIYGLAWELSEVNDYVAYLEHSYPAYNYKNGPDGIYYPLARKHVDVWDSVKHGEFVIDDLARTAMVFAYFSSTNSPSE